MADSSRKYFVSQSGDYFINNPPSNNLLFGGDSTTIRGTNNIIADPKLTVDFKSYNSVIMNEMGPLIDAGSSGLESTIKRDFFWEHPSRAI